jgi:hypothetical protein
MTLQLVEKAPSCCFMSGPIQSLPTREPTSGGQWSDHYLEFRQNKHCLCKNNHNIIEVNERGPESRNPNCPIQKTLKCGEDNFDVVDLRQSWAHPEFAQECQKLCPQQQGSLSLKQPLLRQPFKANVGRPQYNVADVK